MRDVYYQSAGNPVQYDRLPASRPDTEMLSPSPPMRDRLRRITRLHGWAAAIVFGLLATYRGRGWTFLEPFDLIGGGTALVVGLVSAVVQGNLRRLCDPFMLVGLGLLCMNSRMPWTGHIALAALTIGALTFAFGWHGVVVATAAPPPRSNSRNARR